MKKEQQHDEETDALVDGVPHSLPSPEHVLHETALRLSSSSSPKKRRFCFKSLCIMAAIALAVAAVCLPVYQKKSQNQSSNNSQTSIIEADHDDDNKKEVNNDQQDSYDLPPDESEDYGDYDDDNDNDDDGNYAVPIRFDPEGEMEPENPAWQITRSSKSRLNAVLEFLSRQNVSNRDALQNSNSPQYRAALWMADQDGAYLDLPTGNDDPFWFVQRYVLAVVYWSMGGPRWRYKSRFLSDSPVCDWNFELEDDDDTAPANSDMAEYVYGVQCNQEDAVDMIFMPRNNISGSIPAEIGQLLDLYYLGFDSNNIGGSLPAELTYLINLEYLDLDSNVISGEIPAFMNQLVSLNYLGLSSNHLMGAIPELSGLEDLKEIALDNNQLQMGIDNINDCPSLVYLYLSHNLLEGRIHDGTFENLEDLEVLEAGDNLLTGSLPSWIYEQVVVDLHDNFLNENGLPEVDGSYESPLEFLSLYGNDLKGTIPGSYDDLTNIVHLDLSDNDLTGIIPSVFTSEWLRNLYLYKNGFDKSTFPYLQDCQSLEELSLAETNLIGTLPEYLGELSNMVLLDLRDNSLSGQLPESLGDLKSMQYLLLNRNKFTGSVSESLTSLEGIMSLFLDNNQFSGSVNHICDSNLEYLQSFSSDCLSDTVECECCTVCCETGDLECNVWADSLRLTDPSTRDQYLLHIPDK